MIDKIFAVIWCVFVIGFCICTLIESYNRTKRKNKRRKELREFTKDTMLGEAYKPERRSRNATKKE